MPSPIWSVKDYGSYLEIGCEDGFYHVHMEDGKLALRKDRDRMLEDFFKLNNSEYLQQADIYARSE